MLHPSIRRPLNIAGTDHSALKKLTWVASRCTPHRYELLCCQCLIFDEVNYNKDVVPSYPVIFVLISGGRAYYSDFHKINLADMDFSSVSDPRL